MNTTFYILLLFLFIFERFQNSSIKSKCFKSTSKLKYWYNVREICGEKQKYDLVLPLIKCKPTDFSEFKNEVENKILTTLVGGDLRHINRNNIILDIKLITKQIRVKRATVWGS